MSSNIIGTYNVFEAARLARVDRVVFASSNHVVGMFEVASGPSLYRLDDPRMIDHRDEIRPDSIYGTSKVFGEALGRYYAERYDMSVVCLRIGSVLPDDDPDGPSVAEASGWLGLSVADRYRRLRATWLSQRDCGRLVASALDAEVGWAVVFGTSANPRRIWDLEHAREAIGYEPQDSAPEWLGERPPSAPRPLALPPGLGVSTWFPRLRRRRSPRPGLRFPSAAGCHREGLGEAAHGGRHEEHADPRGGRCRVLRHRGCPRPGARRDVRPTESDRLAALEPGHDTPGAEYVYVRGVGTERSMLRDYLEAEAAMMEADCEEISR